MIATVTMFDATVPDVQLQLYANNKYSLSRFPRSRARYHQYSVDASSSSGTDVHGRRKMAQTSVLL